MTARARPAARETSLRRGVAILIALAGDEAAADDGLTVTRIAQLMGREKSQVSRTLKALAEHGLVDRDERTLAYRLGSTFFALAAHAADGRLLRSAVPYLRDVVGELRERAHLSVREGTRVVTLLSESPPQTVQAVDWVGRSVPVHCTASGRALLLDHEPKDVAALLAEVVFGGPGPNAPRDLRDLGARMSAARERGYAVADEELERGLVAVAAPVRDFRGTIVAALNVSAPKFRFEDRLYAAGEAVVVAAGRLSSVLGHEETAAPKPRAPSG